MVGKQNNGWKLNAIFLGIAGIFCIACLILSAWTPRIPLDIGVQAVGGETAVFVKRTLMADGEFLPGDVIEAVSSHAVHSKSEFYRQIARAHGGAELSIRRFGGRFQRPVRASEFAHGALPVGVRPDDRPVQIADENGGYAPLEDVDFDALRSILEERGGAVNVVFRRQEEILTATLPMRSSAERTYLAATVLLLLGLIALAAWRTRRPASASRHYARAVIVGSLGAMGIMTLALWNVLPANPLLMIAGIAALTMCKPFDLDYHLTQGTGGQKVIRAALYVGPALTLVVPVWMCAGELPVLWGGSVHARADLKFEALLFLPMIWVMLLTIVDTGLAAYRRSRDPSAPIRAHEVGLAVCAVLAVFVFVLMRNDTAGARGFLIAMIVAQSMANVIPALRDSAPCPPCQLDAPVFSLVPVRALLDRAQSLLGDWEIHVVIERPSPRHVVSMVRSDDPAALCGIELNVLPAPWRDFLDMFHIEGSYLNGEPQDSEDPVAGVAERLGIAMALPMAENVAGTLTCLTFLVASPGDGHPRLLEFRLNDRQREELVEILDGLTECAAAMVYHSAEMSLDYLGDELGAACPPAMAMYPTMSGLPHGFEDEDAPAGTPAAPAPAGDVAVLRSQVQALYSQQFRQCAVTDTEFTESQKSVLADLCSLDPPFLLVGESGTGRKTIAMMTHQSRSSGPFLTVDASAMPESIFAIDVIGDGDAPGLIESAAGGALYIENAQRLSDAMLERFLAAVNRLPARSSIGLYLSVDVSPDVCLRRDDPSLPAEIRTLAERCDAEVIVVEPLRVQKDILQVADFLRERQSVRHGRDVEGFDAQAARAIQAYAWPGNFPELRLVVERAVLQTHGAEIAPADLGAEFENLVLGAKNASELGDRVQKLQSLNESQMHQIHTLSAQLEEIERQRRADDNALDSLLDGSFADIEKRILARILTKYNNDPEKAADALELNRTRFFHKLHKYQIIDFS